MVLNYTTENVKKVIDLFQAQKIVMLKIWVKQDGTQLISYALEEEQDKKTQSLANERRFSQLGNHLMILKHLNMLYTNALAGSVPESFELYYDLTSRSIGLRLNIAWEQNKMISNEYEEKRSAAESFDSLMKQIVLTGIGNTELPGLYTKDSKKRNKLNPATVMEAMESIKKIFS